MSESITIYNPGWINRFTKSRIYDHKNCDKKCSEKYYLGMIVKYNDEKAYCVHSNISRRCAINDGGVGPDAPYIGSWQQLEDSCEAIFYAVLKPHNLTNNIFYLNNSLYIQSLGSGTAPVGPSDNCSKSFLDIVGAEVCQVPDDNFDKPYNLRYLREYIDFDPLININNIIPLYASYDDNNNIKDFLANRPTNSSFPAIFYENHRAHMCNYTLSLAKEVYTLDINLYAPARVLYKNIITQINNNGDECRSYPDYPAISGIVKVPSCLNSCSYECPIDCNTGGSLPPKDSKILQTVNHGTILKSTIEGCCEPNDNNDETYCCDEFEQVCCFNAWISPPTPSCGPPRNKCAKITSEERELFITSCNQSFITDKSDFGASSAVINDSVIDYGEPMFKFTQTVCMLKYNSLLKPITYQDVYFEAPSEIPTCGYIGMDYEYEESKIITPFVITVEYYYCEKSYL